MFRDHKLSERFWNKVVISGECWEWTAALNHGGYGEYWERGQMRRAHRVSFIALVGAIPDGLQLDHICRNRACVNPTHLEAVSSRENTVRGLLPQIAAAQNLSKINCPSGHPYSGSNLFIARNGDRKCRTCQKLRDSLRWKSRKDALWNSAK